MPKVTVHHSNASVDVLEVDPGTSIMRAALEHGVTGIVGECGGQAMCATCHVYVRQPYLDALPAMSEDEEEMLDFTAAPRDAMLSRLSCQLLLDDGQEIEVDLPERQV